MRQLENRVEQHMIRVEYRLNAIETLTHSLRAAQCTDSTTADVDKCTDIDVDKMLDRLTVRQSRAGGKEGLKSATESKVPNHRASDVASDVQEDRPTSGRGGLVREMTDRPTPGRGGLVGEMTKDAFYLMRERAKGVLESGYIRKDMASEKSWTMVKTYPVVGSPAGARAIEPSELDGPDLAPLDSISEAAALLTSVRSGSRVNPDPTAFETPDKCTQHLARSCPDLTSFEATDMGTPNGNKESDVSVDDICNAAALLRSSGVGNIEINV